MSTKQQTLKAPISFSGKGLHTGVKVTMTVNPADADTGIVFRRTDIEGQPIIPALCDNVVDTSRGTTIESGGHRVSTIEHIMSALWTLGVDNAVIDIDAGETPIMDGSACAYAKAITEVGITDQQAERKFYHVTEKMVYTIPEKGVAIILYPDDEFSSLRYCRRLFSSEPMPAEATVSEKSSSSRSNSASTARLSSAHASMATDVSLSISSSISLPGVQVQPTTNISVP